MPVHNPDAFKLFYVFSLSTPQTDMFKLTRSYTFPFLISLTIFAFLFALTFAIVRDRTLAESEIHQDDDECKQKLQHYASRTINRTDYTMVSLVRNIQRLRGKIVHEQGIKVAQFLSVPYADKPKVRYI